jgi:hypothetical protein
MFHIHVVGTNQCLVQHQDMYWLYIHFQQYFSYIVVETGVHVPGENFITGTDCTGSFNSNYNMITTMTVPESES